MRRATALAVSVRRLSWSISSHFVAIHPWSADNSRKSQKISISKAQGHLKSSMLLPLKSLSPVLVMISSMFMSIRNCFHARRADVGKNNHFLEGYPSLTLACAGIFEIRPTGSALGLLKSAFDAKDFIRRLSWSIPAISSQFAFKICVAARNRKKWLMTLILEVHGRSRSSILIRLKPCHKCLLW